MQRRAGRISVGLSTYFYREDDFSQGRDTTDQYCLGQLTYAVTPEFHVSLRANTESNNIITLQKQTYNGWGWGLDWAPSPRTQLFADGGSALLR